MLESGCNWYHWCLKNVVAAICASNRSSFDFIYWLQLFDMSVSSIQTVWKINTEQRIQSLRTHKLHGLARAWTFCRKIPSARKRKAELKEWVRRPRNIKHPQFIASLARFEYNFASLVLGCHKTKLPETETWQIGDHPYAVQVLQRQMIGVWFKVKGGFLFWYAKIVAEFAVCTTAYIYIRLYTYNYV